MRKGIIRKGYTNRKNEWLKNVILEIINKYKNRIGSKPITRIILKEYGSMYSDHQIGRIMVENNWKCTICAACKQKEIKNTTVKINDIVLRDYDNLSHNCEIYAIDAAYLFATKDSS